MAPSGTLPPIKNMKILIVCAKTVHPSGGTSKIGQKQILFAQWQKMTRYLLFFYKQKKSKISEIF